MKEEMYRNIRKKALYEKRRSTLFGRTPLSFAQSVLYCTTSRKSRHNKNEKQWTHRHSFVQYRESEIAFLLNTSDYMPEL